MVERVAIDITARDKTRAAFASVNNQLNSMSRLVGRVGGQFGLVFGAGSGIMVTSTKRAIEFADAIAKQADAVDLGVEALQQFQFGAERSGIAVAQFNTNMVAFVKRVGEARSGVGPLTSFLKKYDENLLENIKNTKDQEQALYLVAEAISKAETATDKAAIANAAFSRAGVKMVNMLRNGKTGLDDMRQAAIDAGVVMNESLTRKAEVINDRWDTLSATIGNKFKSALITAADASLNFLKIYNDLDTVLWSIVDAEERLLDAQDRMDSARGRNLNSARAARDQAKKDLDSLREQEKVFRDMEERINSMRSGASVSMSGALVERVKAESNALDELLDRYIAEEQAVEKSYLAKTEYIQALESEVRLLQYSGRELAIQTRLADAHARGIIDQDESIRALTGTLYDYGQMQKTVSEDGEKQFNELKTAVEGWGRSFADTLLSGEQNFTDFAQAIIDQLARIAVAQATNPIFNMFADAVGGVFSGGVSGSAASNLMTDPSGFVYNLPSFSGGGFTGEGVRSGGIDGMGGFLSVLHPNETVLDHESSAAGGTINYAPVFNIDARGSDSGMLPKIQQIADHSASRAVEQFKRDIRNAASAARLVGRRG